MSGDPRCAWPVAALLGEGPMWDSRDGRLWFVDIKSGDLHGYDPATGTRQSHHLGGNPCFVLPAAPDGLLIGNRDTLALRQGDMTTPVATVPMAATDRCNDATVDGRGRVWFGTMDDLESAPTGRVHLFDRGVVTEAGGDAVITNGPAISSDDRWLYHVDTLAGQIWRFDISERRTLRDGTLFATIRPEDGTPDGVTIDVEDHVWVGLWGGWSARRYAPDGRLVGEIRFPCANITKLAFGGPDLRTAFATTARIGLDEAALAEQPLAGGLFAVEVDVPGRPLPLVRLG